MIYNKKIQGVEFTLVCESWFDHSSWGHKVTLYRNNTVKVGTYKVLYYNRTWESYQYQSAIKGVIYNALQHIETELKTAFKAARGYKVISAKRAKEFAAYLQQNKKYLLYKELYSMF